MCMPSKPRPTSWPPHFAVGALPTLTGASHERMRMLPYTTMSPWPCVPPQLVTLTVWVGFAGSETSMIRKPS